MKLEEWNTYRTRFLVKAKRINSNLTFVDHLGRQHSGRKGDYLVESADGVLSIAPRRIFEDIYVPMSAHQTDAGITTEENNNEQPCDALNFEPLEIEEIKLPNSVSTRQPVTGSLRLRKNVGKGLDKVDIQQPSLSSSGEAPHNRKLPQTFRDRRTTSPRTGLVLM